MHTGAYDIAASECRVYLAHGDAGMSVYRPCSHPYRYWLDNAAHLPGLFGSQWRTDVVARNTGIGDADVEFRLHSPAGVQLFTNTISPRDQGVFEDIVGMMDYEGKGASRCVPVNCCRYRVEYSTKTRKAHLASM